jgi:hypothetical protein
MIVSGNYSRWALMAGILQGQNESRYIKGKQSNGKNRLEQGERI